MSEEITNNKEYKLSFNGQEYTLTDKTLDALQQSADNYAERYLKKADRENYKTYAKSVIDNIRNGNPIGLTPGNVQKNIFGHYKGTREKTIFDNQFLKILGIGLNQSTGTSTTSTERTTSSNSTIDALNKELQKKIDEQKNKFNLYQFLKDSHYITDATLNNVSATFKDKSDEYLLGIIKEAIQNQAKKTGKSVVNSITLENVEQEARNVGIPVDQVQGFLSINKQKSQGSNQYQLPEDYTLAEGGDQFDNYFLVTDKSNRRQVITRDSNGHWTTVANPGANSTLLNYNQLVARGANKPILYTDGKGDWQIGIYGQDGFNEHDNYALNKLYTANQFKMFDYKGNQILIKDNEGNASSIDIPNLTNYTGKQSGKVYDLSPHFEGKLGDKHLLITDESTIDLFKNFNDTYAILVDANGNSQAVKLSLEQDGKVSLTYNNGQTTQKENLGFLNPNASVSDFSWTQNGGSNNKVQSYANAIFGNRQNDTIKYNVTNTEPLGVSEIFDNTGVRRDRGLFGSRWLDWESGDVPVNWILNDDQSVNSAKISQLANQVIKDGNEKKVYGFTQRYAVFVYNVIKEHYKGNINEFFKDANLEGNSNKQELFLKNLYKLLSGNITADIEKNKKGGVLKYQLGGISTNMNQSTIENLIALQSQRDALKQEQLERQKQIKNQPGRIGDATADARELDVHDYTQLASSGLSALSMTGGLVGVAAQSAATVIDLINDATNDRVSSGEMWKNLGLNLAFTCMSLIPGLSSLKLANAAGKGVKIATKAGKAVKNIEKAGNITEETKAAVNLLTKGLDSAKDVLKNKGLVEKGLQHIGSVTKGAANLVGKAATVYGVTSGVSSGINAIKDLSDGKGVSINDAESIIFGIAASKNIFRGIDNLALKRITKRAAQTEAKELSKKINFGGKEIDFKFKAGASKEDIKNTLKTKAAEEVEILQKQIDNLPVHVRGKGKLKQRVYDNQEEYNALSEQLEKMRKASNGEGLDDVVKDILDFKTKAKSGYQQLITSSKNRWDEWTNPYSEGRVLKSEEELEKLGIGVLERRGLNLAKKYGFAQEASLKGGFNTNDVLQRISQASKYNFNNPNKTTRAFAEGFLYKSGGKLDTLRKVVKFGEGGETTKLYHTKEYADAALLNMQDKQNYKVIEVDAPSDPKNKVYKIVKKETPGDSSEQIVPNTSGTTEGSGGTNGSNGGNNGDNGGNGAGNTGNTNEKKEPIAINSNIFLDAFQPEEPEKQEKSIDLYPLLSGTSYFNNLIGNTAAFKDKMSAVKPVYKVPVYKYNQTENGFDEQNAALNEIAQGRRQAEEENKSSDQAFNNANMLAYIANELNAKNKFAARSAAIEEQTRKVQDENEYNNRLMSKQVKEANDLMDQNVAELRANIRSQYDQSNAKNFDNWFRENAQHFYSQANRNWEYEKQNALNEYNTDYESKNRIAQTAYQTSYDNAEKAYKTALENIEKLDKTDAEKNSFKEQAEATFNKEIKAITRTFEDAIIKNKEEYIRKASSINKPPLPGEYTFTYTPRFSRSDSDAQTFILSQKKGGTLTFIEKRELERMKQAYRKLQKDAELVHKSVKESNKQINNVLSALEKERLLLMHKYYEIGNK